MAQNTTVSPTPLSAMRAPTNPCSASPLLSERAKFTYVFLRFPTGTCVRVARGYPEELYRHRVATTAHRAPLTTTVTYPRYLGMDPSDVAQPRQELEFALGIAAVFKTVREWGCNGGVGGIGGG